MGKGLRIINIIILILLTILQAFNLYLEISIFSTIGQIQNFGQGLGMAIYLYFVIIISAAILLFTIIETILSAFLKRKMETAQILRPKIDIICKIMPWIYTLINAISIIMFFILK